VNTAWTRSSRSFSQNPEDDDHECHVCGGEIPTERGAQPVEGKEYAAMRHNDQCEPYAFTERYVHKSCLPEYLEQSE